MGPVREPIRPVKTLPFAFGHDLEKHALGL
jgi:hypothetical protein